MDNFFSKQFFETWLNQASPETKDWFQKEADYLKGRIKPNATILDVGCGFGRHIQMLAGFSKAVVGIDNDKIMIDKANENLKNFDNVKLFLQDAGKMEFSDDTFDYVVCANNTFGNFREAKSHILNEMKRVCKKEGEIIISVYSEDALEIRKNDYEKVGLHITKIEGGKVTTKEGLISEQFSKDQLIKIFRPLDLTVSINKLTPISYICVLKNNEP
ncbi:MAG TPA: class I SAM-dependent methyltransferase [Candidatus Pacearchaeota archaeon]|nr:class I SAM-dependent methyltransferase [Candidatus Pacearchaeota archaeon]